MEKGETSWTTKMMQMQTPAQGVESYRPSTGITMRDLPASLHAHNQSDARSERAQMFCSTCGSRVYKSGRFCPRCGASQISADGTVTSLEDALIGATIDDKYQITSKIGNGNTGTVYRAIRTRIGDEVAIKVLRPNLVADQQSVEQFLRYAQIASRIKHPGMVAMYDFGVARQGLVYVVMELIEGQSLRSIIARKGAFTSSVAFDIIAQVCGTLDAAHNQGIVHGDLRPERIVVTSTTSGSLVKVLDFGIAILPETPAGSSDPTSDEHPARAPHYMSPEQCMGMAIDGRSDIYSLGVILYEMLCGALPFNSQKWTAIVIQQVTSQAPPLRTINPAIPSDVETVIQRSLEKSREARPETAMALWEEFSAAIQPTRSAPAASTRPQAQRTNHVESSGRLTAEAEARPTELTHNDVVQREGQSKRKMLLYAFAVILIMAMAGGAATLLMRASGGKNSAQVAHDPTQIDVTLPQENVETMQPADPSEPPVPPPGMLYVPGGDFMMGSDTGSVSERPAHNVTVNAFFIDRTEVTCEEYAAFVRATKHPAPVGWINGAYPAGAAKKPVTGVSWSDANAYALWAGKRLPTEEEWEFAARGTDGRLFPWGNQWGTGVANADVGARSHNGVENGGAHPKGQSPFGALDMVGNAWEWTASDLIAYPGGQLSEPVKESHKVIRGGSWKNNRDQANATFRKCHPATGGDYLDIGFRCVKGSPVAVN